MDALKDLTLKTALLIRQEIATGDIARAVVEGRNQVIARRKKALDALLHAVFHLAELLRELSLRAEKALPGRVAYYAALMGVEPAGVKITTARKRFGSCSGKNSLCFSCLLMLYPPEAVDCVVVHELAHIRHHDHSPAFYAFIDSVMPDYRRRERLLKAAPEIL